MTDLKPCPFCGGKAQFARGFDHGEIGAIRWVSCTRCGAMTLSKLYKTEEEAAVAWNTRNEPITIMSPITTVSEGEPQTYVPLRTCRNTHTNRWFACSECGYGFIDMYPCDETDINEQPHYCPNCGAKVVEE